MNFWRGPTLRLGPPSITDAAGHLIGGQGMAGEIGQGEGGERGDLYVRRTAIRRRAVALGLVVLAGQNLGNSCAG